ncbi:hypothetical protein Talka_02118 [Tepidimonas alkaliphilus]|uniref:DUF349 domain-containing protein n=1 Tax=Tepidimonas alkaliphilus TaxID=2588942 RepID=A0A554W4H6_9BURK|nr:DUF349 domain-containing protein [Tepidimonas alkaliphilus]TSE18476.1 hypothetical protein Talka_02118 [Tepidimonas alkaliphilus]
MNTTVSPSIADLDALTGGAFAAPTAGERAARLRAWLATQPAAELLRHVYRELAPRDKGAAKIIKERLEELKRQRAQEEAASEWAARAQALLAQTRLPLADALAWERDAAKAGAPLSREPLASLRQQLAQRLRAAEELTTRVQVEREAASLLVQRIDLLSTRAIAEAEAAHEALARDVAQWQARAEALAQDPAAADLEPRHAGQLQTARQQVAAVWQAFDSALAQARRARDDAQAALPGVPLWDDEIRALRGEPVSSAAAPTAKAVQALAQAELLPTLEALERELAEGHTKAMVRLAGELRHRVKLHGRHAGAELEARAQAALAKAKELEDWARWRADQLREELLAKAEALTQGEEAQRPKGRALQEAIRQLREQWRAIDQGGAPPNQALWKRFDAACNRAHEALQAWRDEIKAQHEAAQQARQALIEELRAWTAAHAENEDWKAQQRDLHAFAERWRQAGPVSEKVFATLRESWKEAMAAAYARLEAAQADSVRRRQALIAEAEALAAEPRLRADAVRALQQRWQHEAQRVPLERRQEQKLWEAFRAPLDAAFARRQAERAQLQAALSAHDQAVLQAAQALEEACAQDDAAAIRAAMDALRRAVEQPPAPEAAPQPPAAAAAESPTQPASAAAPRPLVARRGDDRPGVAPAAAASGRSRPAEAAGRRPQPPERAPARPRLGEAAFRAQRQALQAAEARLRELAARAHGEALTALLHAWAQRDAQALPAAVQLGRAAAARAAWAQALANPPAADAAAQDEALLRLEIAADLPTPAEHLEARRRLQLQLLTRRHEPGPAETWTQDVARVLAGAHDEVRARRLQAALKVLLRR